MKKRSKKAVHLARKERALTPAELKKISAGIDAARRVADTGLFAGSQRQVTDYALYDYRGQRLY